MQVNNPHKDGAFPSFFVFVGADAYISPQIMQRQTRGDVGIAPYITFGKLFCEMRTPEGRPYKKK